MYLRDGAVIEQAVDLRVPGPISDWAACSYHSRVSGSEALGGKWLNGNADYQLIQEGMYDVSVIVDATSKRHFNYFTGSYTSPGACAPHAGARRLELRAHSDRLDVRGSEHLRGLLHVLDTPGQLEEKTTLAWQAADKEGMLYTYNGSHQVTQITTVEGQDYNIVFSYTGNTIAKIEVRTGADTSTRVRQVEYTYCDTDIHSADVGADGDLVQATVSELKTGGSAGTPGDWIVRTTQYRYGANGLLKAVFEPDAVQRDRQPRGYRRRG